VRAAERIAQMALGAFFGDKPGFRDMSAPSRRAATQAVQVYLDSFCSLTFDDENLTPAGKVGLARARLKGEL